MRYLGCAPQGVASTTCRQIHCAVGLRLFEVQYHTPESWEAKQSIENPEVSESDKATARKYQQDFSAAVPIPEGAAEIPEYDDEGR